MPRCLHRLQSTCDLAHGHDPKLAGVRRLDAYSNMLRATTYLYPSHVCSAWFTRPLDLTEMDYSEPGQLSRKTAQATSMP